MKVSFVSWFIACMWMFVSMSFSPIVQQPYCICSTSSYSAGNANEFVNVVLLRIQLIGKVTKDKKERKKAVIHSVVATIYALALSKSILVYIFS